MILLVTTNKCFDTIIQTIKMKLLPKFDITFHCKTYTGFTGSDTGIQTKSIKTKSFAEQ